MRAEDYSVYNDSKRVPNVGRAWLNDLMNGRSGGDMGWMPVYVPDSGPPSGDVLPGPTLEKQPTDVVSHLGEKALASI